MKLNRMLLFAAAIVASAFAIAMTPMAVTADDVISFDVTPQDLVVHQFGAVSYLDDSGFYGVADSPAYTNPNPMPDDPATVMRHFRQQIAMLGCSMFRLTPGGEPGGDGDPPTPDEPKPDTDPPVGDPPAEGFCT